MAIEGIPKEVDEFNDWYHTALVCRKIKLFKTLMAFTGDDIKRIAYRNGLDVNRLQDSLYGKLARKEGYQEEINGKTKTGKDYAILIDKYIAENIDSLIEVLNEEKEKTDETFLKYYEQVEEFERIMAGGWGKTKFEAPKTEINNQYLTIKDLNKITGISRSKLQQLVENGHLNFFKIGGRYRFFPDDVYNFLESLDRPKVIKEQYRQDVVKLLKKKWEM